MDWLLVLPLAIPLFFGVVSILARNNLLLQRWFGVLGMVVLLVVSIAILIGVRTQGILVDQMGNWIAPFGITLVADHLTAFMVLITAIMGLAVAIYSLANIDAERESFGYYPLLHILLMGVNGVFLTGDLFNMYVWFEVMLITSFVLLALGNRKEQMDGAIKYVTINLVSSLVFLSGVGILYGMTGTLNMADMAVRLDAVDSPGLVTTASMFFLVSFGIKAAVFPLFFWLPASYHTPPVAVSAIFAALLSKVGVYALIRVFTLLFVQETGYTHQIILWVAAVTMLTGVLGAVMQTEFRKLLSFHIISQIGYMIMGLGLYSPLGIVGSVFYVIHNIIAKTNLFLVSGVANRIAGSFHLKHLGGLYRKHPFLSIMFIIPAFGLAGFPPLSGFWAKLTLTIAGLDAREYVVVGIALFVGLLTLFSMTKIFAEAFWKPLPSDRPKPAAEVEGIPGVAGIRTMMVPIVLLAVMTVVLGLGAGLFINVSLDAAEELLDRTRYINAVLGDP